jgi:hypothetical protein
MIFDEYEYEYHDVANDADDIYYNDGTDEPWVDDDADGDVIFDEQDQYQDYLNKYDAYYHDIADELDD